MLQAIVSLVIFLFPLAYSPGPGNMFFAANGARFGLLGTLRASLGYHVATWLVTAAIGLGFVEIRTQMPLFFVGLKLAGSLYVFWIAWTFLRAGVLREEHDAKPASFWDGFILLVVNPKAYVIIALMFTQFMDAVALGGVMNVLVITTVFTLNNFIAFSVWTLVGDRISVLFRTPDSARRLNVGFACVLCLVAIWMLLA